MTDVECVRCGQTREEIQGVSYGGKIGETLKEKICDICWKLWYEESIKLINENHISLRDAKGREFIASQMKAFLKLEPTTEAPQDE